MEINSTESIIKLSVGDIDFLHKGLFYLLGFSWVSDEASGRDIDTDDDFLLVDKNGFTIASKRASAPGDDLGKSFGTPIPVDGLELKKLNGGICMIYLKVK